MALRSITNNGFDVKAGDILFEVISFGEKLLINHVVIVAEDHFNVKENEVITVFDWPKSIEDYLEGSMNTEVEHKVVENEFIGWIPYEESKIKLKRRFIVTKAKLLLSDIISILNIEPNKKYYENLPSVNEQKYYVNEEQEYSYFCGSCAGFVNQCYRYALNNSHSIVTDDKLPVWRKVELKEIAKEIFAFDEDPSDAELRLLDIKLSKTELIPLLPGYQLNALLKKGPYPYMPLSTEEAFLTI